MTDQPIDGPAWAFKVCTKCQMRKPVAEFYSDIRSADGLRSWCKTCHSANAATHRQTPAQKADYARRSGRVPLSTPYLGREMIAERAAERRTAAAEAREQAEREAIEFAERKGNYPVGIPYHNI